MSVQTTLLLLALPGLSGIAFGYFLRWIISLGKRGSMELEIRQMRMDAEEKSKRIIGEAEEKAKEKAETLSGEHKERERELKVTEERLVRKEELLDKRQVNVDTEADTLSKRLEEVKAAKERADELVRAQQEKLEKVAGLSALEAKEDLIKSIEKQSENDLESRMR